MVHLAKNQHKKSSVNVEDAALRCFVTDFSSDKVFYWIQRGREWTGPLEAFLVSSPHIAADSTYVHPAKSIAYLFSGANDLRQTWKTLYEAIPGQSAGPKQASSGMAAGVSAVGLWRLELMRKPSRLRRSPIRNLRWPNCATFWPFLLVIRRAPPLRFTVSPLALLILPFSLGFISDQELRGSLTGVREKEFPSDRLPAVGVSNKFSAPELVLAFGS
ncbi:hypothetical protein CEXT_250811 [Caerostris extrusa]|uniref:Uncharacterized protein n=1 Tax=Caerostris extrusa TaxID=172846 RepID=A0AAV4TDN9_CAEEX|nr:hypothetical protein CEXT_250811 [Caerostris extrusa]